MNDLLNDQGEKAAADEAAAAEVDAVLHDCAYSEVEPDLDQLLAIARAACPASPLPALRARVLLERSDETGMTALLADLLAASLTALHSERSQADAALLLRVQVHRAVERAEIRVAAASRRALEFRCSQPGCIRDAWWSIQAYTAADGLVHGRVIRVLASCREHADDIRRDLLRTPGLSTTYRSLLPGHPDYPRDNPPAATADPFPPVRITCPRHSWPMRLQEGGTVGDLVCQATTGAGPCAHFSELYPPGMGSWTVAPDADGFLTVAPGPRS